MRKLRCVVATVVLAAIPALSLAADSEQEIEFLLTSVAESDCSFIRNGSAHSAKDAAAHLRMKYKRGKRYVSSAESFIDRLASGSSLTRRPYQIDCAETAPVSSGEWLINKLQEYRTRQTGG